MKRFVFESTSNENAGNSDALLSEANAGLLVAERNSVNSSSTTGSQIQTQVEQVFGRANEVLYTGTPSGSDVRTEMKTENTSRAGDLREYLDYMENKFAKELSSSGRISDQLARMLKYPYPYKVSVPNINKCLRYTGFQLEESECSEGHKELVLVVKDAWKDPFKRELDNIEWSPISGFQSRAVPIVRNFEERIQLEKRIVEQTIQNNRIPARFLDLLKGPAGSVRTEEMNVMFADRDSNLRLEVGTNKEGHDEISLTSSGNLQEQYLIKRSPESGAAVHPVVKLTPARDYMRHPYRYGDR